MANHHAPLMGFHLPQRSFLAKAFCAFCLILSAPYAAMGQANEYVFQPTDLAYTPVLPDSTIGTASSGDASYTVPLKFSFPFGDFRYTTLRVSSNGFVLFGTGTLGNGTNTAFANTRFPSGRVFNAVATTNNLTFCGFNQDLRANGIPIGLKWGGTAPNRFLVIQYEAFRRASTGFEQDVINFQIAVYESGQLEARYGNMTILSPTATGTMVGIRGANRTDIFPLRATWTAPVGGVNNRDSLVFSAAQRPNSGRVFRFVPNPASQNSLRLLSVAPANGALSGCPRSSQEPLRFHIQNQGTQAQTTFELGYYLNANAVVRRSITLPAPLAPGATASVNLSGTDGMDLRAIGRYSIKAFVNLAAESNRRNDTARTSLNFTAATPFPTNTPLTTIRVASANGWRRATGVPIRISDSSNVWRSSFPFSSETIGAYFDAGNAAINDWFYRPGLIAGGPVAIRFRMAVTLNFGGTTPVPSILDDTLKVVVSRDCGQSWETVAAFNNAGLQAGLFRNALEEFTYTLSTTPGTLAVGFYVTSNGTGAPAPYRWHLDNVEFLFEKDLTVTDVRAANQSRFSGCPGTTQEPILVTVANNGSDVVNTAQVGFQIPGQPLRTRTVTFTPPLGQGDDTTFTFSGPQAADLSQAIPYYIKAFAVDPTDGNPGNDSLATQLDLTRTTPIPYGYQVSSLSTAREKGWRQLSGRNTPGIDSTRFWKAAFSLGETISGTQPANNTPAYEWFYRSSYRSSGAVGFRFNFGVTSGTSGTNPLASMGNDTLYLKLSENCGSSWRTVASFHQSGLASGQFDNTLKTFTYSLTTNPGSLAVAFYFSNGGNGSTSAYTIHIDNLQFLVDKDVSVRNVSVAGAGRLFGCPLGPNQAVTITVANNGITPLTTVPISYTVNGAGLKTKNAFFNPSLQIGDSATVVFSGTDGADLSQSGPYLFKAYTHLVGEQYPDNDTLNQTIALQATTPIPGPILVTSYNEAKGSGWKQVGGWPISRDTSFMWKPTTPVYGAGIAAFVTPADTSRAEWFLRSGLVANGAVGMRFKLAVITGTGGVNPITDIGDDTLKIVVSYDCGRTWRTLDRFHMGSINATRIDNTLKSFFIPLATSATPVSVAFVVNTMGTASTETYRWLIDDIGFAASNDIAALGVVVPALRYTGCTRTNAEDVFVIVQNSGASTITSAQVGYGIDPDPLTIKTVAFAPALQPGEQRIVPFTGPEGADLTGTATYDFIAWATIADDGSPGNDSTRASIEPGTETTLPGVPRVADFNSALSNGWQLGSGKSITRSGSVIWQQTNVAVGSAISASIATTTDIAQDWLYRTGYKTTGPVTMRYRLAVARGTAGQDAITNAVGLGDDTLRVMLSNDCGRNWAELAHYSNADLTAGRISNDFATFTAQVSAGGSPVTIGFYVTNNNTRIVAAYRWLITDIEFGSGIDEEALSLDLPTAQAGYCNNQPRPVALTVRNNGFTTVTSIPVAYTYAGGAEVEHVFTTSLASLSSTKLVFPQAKWVTPTLPSGELKVYVKDPNQTAGSFANDTVRRTLMVSPPLSVPRSPFYTLTSFISAGFSTQQLRNGVESGRNGWGSGRVGATGTAFSPFSTNDSAAIENWLISPLYNLQSGLVLRFRIAVVPQNPPALNFGNDTLKLMYRNNCGDWSLLRAFTKATYDSGRIGQTLFSYGYNIPVGGGNNAQFAFVATNGGTYQVPDYSWHITAVTLEDIVSDVRPALDDRLALFPNPAGSRIQIRYGEKASSASILNAQGLTVHSFTLQNGHADIDVADYPPGIYILRVMDSAGILTRRFIKE